MRHCFWIFALFLLSIGELSAEEFGYELQDGKLAILMYGGYDDWKKNASENDKRSVTEIYIEEGVPVIPNFIFKDMPHVRSVSIPSSVTMVGGAAFAGCTNLSSVTFAKDSELRTIGGYAFCETALESVVIPASVTVIRKGAFRYCSSLSSVIFAGNPKLSVIGDWAFCETSLRSVVIPATVTIIGKAAFTECKRLSSVTFVGDQNLRTIGAGAFSGTKLNSVIIPSSVTMVGDGAFRYCRRLSFVTFGGDNLKTIGDWTFSETALASFLMPSTVTTIGAGAFAKTPIESVKIPSSVKAIEGAAFNDCKKLSSVTFSEKSELDTIGAGVFYGTALSRVELPFSVKTIGAGSFSHSTLKSVIIPASVTDIECAAFSHTLLTSVIIPSSVKTIGKEVFHSCSKLTDVTFLSSIAPSCLGEDVFTACFSLVTIFIPEGSSGYFGGNWDKYEKLIKQKVMSVSSDSLPVLSNVFFVGEMGSFTFINPWSLALLLILCVLKKYFRLI